MAVHDPFGLLEPQHAGGEGAESAIDVREYLRGIRRRWKLILMMVVLALGLSLAQYSTSKPVYNATTLIQIDRLDLSSMISNQTPWLGYLYNMEYYPTQYRLLQSRGMAEQVVRALGLDTDPAFAGAAATVADGASADGDRAALAGLANRVRSGVSVSPISGTQLVQISYRSADPQLAARLANGYAQTFIDWGNSQRSGLATQTSIVLRDQIRSLQGEVAEREKQLQTLFRDSSSLDFDPDSDVTTKRLEGLNEQYMAAKRARIEKQARYQELQAQPRESVASLGSSTVQGLLDEKRRLEREYEAKLQTFREDWPEMVELREKISESQRQLDRMMADEAETVLDEARTDYLTTQRQENALEQEINRLKDNMLANASDSVRYNTLRVEAEQRRELLTQLLRRQGETDVVRGVDSTTGGNVRVVDKALVPGRPSEPSLRRSAGVGLGGGLALGLVLALLLELLDRTIKSAAEAERILGKPVLAVIPDLADEGRAGRYRRYGYGYGYGYGGERRKRKWLEKKQVEVPEIELLPYRRPRMAASETYRALRTALLLSSASGLQAIAVTSPTAGEGKTVTSSNLGVVLSQLGWRVLLIDADMRKPRVHDVFGISNRVGLVNYLTGHVGVEELAQTSEVPNLSVIPAGPIPPNPSELLGSDRMQELLAWSAERFQMAVIDTPPVLAVTDSTVVGAMVDGVVLCLRGGKVTREDARLAKDRLERSEVKVFGLVLNGHHASDASYRKAQHYYAAYGEESETSDSAA